MDPSIISVELAICWRGPAEPDPTSQFGLRYSLSKRNNFRHFFKKGLV